MLASIKKVKPALASQNIVQEFTHFLVKDSFVYAQDGRITAAAPLSEDLGYFLVPAQELERTLLTFESAGAKKITIKATDKNLMLSTEKHKSRIKIADPALFKIRSETAGHKHTVTQAFKSALRIVHPFLSKNATQLWAMGAYIQGDKIYATNNVCLISADIEPFGFSGMLPLWAIDFILMRNENLVSLQGDENSLRVEWEDGSWMRSQLIQGEFPEQGITMLNTLTDANNVLTDEWKRAFRECASFCEEEIVLYADKIIGKRDTVEFESLAVTPVTDEQQLSAWHPKFLSSVVDIAEKFDPQNYPRPCTFSGKGFRGIIVGRHMKGQSNESDAQEKEV